MTAATTAAINVVVKQPPIDNLPSSIASNPQQGMIDNQFLAAGTALSANGRTPPPLAPCSPLTISSALEQQQTAADPLGDRVSTGVPVSVVGGPFMSSPPAVPSASASVPSTEERRWKRTPPTQSDPRKLFVGGLPTNGEFFSGYVSVFFIVLVASSTSDLRFWNSESKKNSM
jgi:hypothetical protein